MVEQNNRTLGDVFRDIKTWSLCVGIIMIVLGIYICANPLIGMVALALYIGAAFIIAGLGYSVTSFYNESGWGLFVGLFNIFVGLILVTNLGITTASLPAIFAIWCLAVGIINLVRSVRSYKSSLPWGWALFIGLLGVLFSFLIIAHPLIGAFTITTLIGLYMVAYGVFSVIEYWYLARLNA